MGQRWINMNAHPLACTQTYTRTLPTVQLLDWQPPALLQLFFLFSNVGRGNECTVAAGFTEIPSDCGENPHEQVSLCLQKMVNKTKVTDLLRLFEFNCILCNFVNSFQLVWLKYKTFPLTNTYWWCIFFYCCGEQIGVKYMMWWVGNTCSF